MTIIAGFQCHDGILMCSDTEEHLTQDSKAQVRKVPYFPGPDMSFAIGGAGDGNLADYITQDLVKELSKKPFGWSDAEAWLDDYARKMFDRHVRPYAGLSYVPNVAFLIAIVMDGQARLFKWEGNFAYALPLMTHASIGIGIIQAQQLLSEIQFSYPANWMLFFGVRMMQKVKQLVQGCGGKTEVLFLGKNGIAIGYGVFSIDEIEHVAMMVDEFVIGNILTLVSNPFDLSEKSLDGLFKTQRGALLKLRQKYRDLLPPLQFAQAEQP